MLDLLVPLSPTQARFSIDTLQSRLRRHISVYPSNAGDQTATWMATFGANHADVAEMQRQYQAMGLAERAAARDSRARRYQASMHQKFTSASALALQLQGQLVAHAPRLRAEIKAAVHHYVLADQQKSQFSYKDLSEKIRRLCHYGDEKVNVHSLPYSVFKFIRACTCADDPHESP